VRVEAGDLGLGTEFGGCFLDKRRLRRIGKDGDNCRGNRIRIGWDQHAGFGAVDPDIVYAKLATLAEGAELAATAP